MPARPGHNCGCCTRPVGTCLSRDDILRYGVPAVRTAASEIGAAVAALLPPRLDLDPPMGWVGRGRRLPL